MTTYTRASITKRLLGTLAAFGLGSATVLTAQWGGVDVLVLFETPPPEGVPYAVVTVDGVPRIEEMEIGESVKFQGKDWAFGLEVRRVE